MECAYGRDNIVEAARMADASELPEAECRQHH
jgi:hypothetical protein